MVYIYPSRTQEQTLVWSGINTQSQDIERNKFIKQIDLRIWVTHTNGSTAPTWYHNAPLGMIREVRIVANGSDIRFAGSPVDQYDKNIWDFMVPPRLYQFNTVSTQGVSYGEISIPFCCVPMNDFDLAGVLPSFQLSSLKVFVDYQDSGNAASIASANPPTINSAFTDVTLREIDLTPNDLAQIGKMYTMKTYYETVPISQAYSSFSYLKDLPVGDIKRRIFVQCINNSILASDSSTSTRLVEQYLLEKYSPVDVQLIPRTNWVASRAQDQREYNIVSTNIPDGWTCMDFTACPLDMRPPVKQGDIKFKASINAPTGTATIRFIYDAIY
jgi:hypothetical protein